MALAALGLKTRSHRADLRRLDPAVPPCIAFRHKGSPVAVVSITPRARVGRTVRPRNRPDRASPDAGIPPPNRARSAAGGT
ncbi:hypothetical protein ACFOHS_12010 [Jhaorihella thermophila]